MPRDITRDRLEMLLVARWLDLGRPADGVLRLPVNELTADLGLDDGREGLLSTMAALGDLEEAGAIRVSWAPVAGVAEVEVVLADHLHRDASALFGH